MVLGGSGTWTRPKPNLRCGWRPRPGPEEKRTHSLHYPELIWNLTNSRRYRSSRLSTKVLRSGPTSANQGEGRGRHGNMVRSWDLQRTVRTLQNTFQTGPPKDRQVFCTSVRSAEPGWWNKVQFRTWWKLVGNNKCCIYKRSCTHAHTCTTKYKMY